MDLFDLFQCRQQGPPDHCGAGMVFAVNSDESSQRNFTAFQTLAKELNGTNATTPGSSSSPSAYGAASPSFRVSGVASVIVTFGAIMASIL